MKSLCKKTQHVLTAFNGDVNRLQAEYPELADHLKNCQACHAEAQRIKQMSFLLAGQRVQIEDEEFWEDFETGLYQKLHQSRKRSFLQRISLVLSRFVREFLFQPAYRVGFTFAILFIISYLGYHSIVKQTAMAMDPYDYLYESYQEASGSNPILQSFSGPADQLIELADISGEGK